MKSEQPNQPDFYLPLIYVVKKHGSMSSAAKYLKVSHQLLSYWNVKKMIPDGYKVLLHEKYGVPYKLFFEQLKPVNIKEKTIIKKVKKTQQNLEK